MYDAQSILGRYFPPGGDAPISSPHPFHYVENCSTVDNPLCEIKVNYCTNNKHWEWILDPPLAGVVSAWPPSSPASADIWLTDILGISATQHTGRQTESVLIVRTQAHVLDCESFLMYSNRQSDAKCTDCLGLFCLSLISKNAFLLSPIPV